MSVAVDAGGLTKSFGDLQVLRGVSLRIEAGETVALLGPSGCGKTTLLRILLGLESPEEGRVDAPLGRAGYLPQGALLFPWKTALGNIELPLRIRGESKGARRCEIERWLPAFGLDGFANAYPHELSGGMQQRVGICRALIHDPTLLAMDEPFAALDAMTREEMSIWLLRLWRERQKTVLFVTHNIREAVLLADRVVVMTHRPGRIVKEIKVNLPRPREMDMEFSPEFEAHVAEIRDLIFGLQTDLVGKEG